MKHTGSLLATLVLFFLLASGTAMAKDKDSEDSDYWGDFSLAPKLGYVGHYDLRETDGSLGNRHGFNLNLNFDFGGAGSGTDMAFYYSYEALDTTNGNGDVLDGGINVIGFYFGGSYRFQSGRAYPYIGFGTKMGYGFSDITDHLIEITPKIPIGVTYYILNDLGIVFEFSLGYDMAIYNYNGRYLSDSGWWFSHGIYFDVMAGIRWP
jgi:hypothetical protein